MAIILGANMLYINFCLFKETPMAPKGLTLMTDGAECKFSYL